MDNNKDHNPDWEPSEFSREERRSTRVFTAGQPEEQGGQRPAGSGSSDNGGFAWGLLGFCIPIVGLILYLVWKDEKPRTAKAAGKGALISVIAYAALYVLLIVVGMAAALFFA